MSFRKSRNIGNRDIFTNVRTLFPPKKIMYCTKSSFSRVTMSKDYSVVTVVIYQ